MKTLSIKLADMVSNFIGSWTFIIVQSTILSIWIISNIVKISNFDPYPFILCNLFLSFEAAYATPLILMSSKRQGEIDSAKLNSDLVVDSDTNKRLKQMEKDILTIKILLLKLEKQ
jgi:uncharacterized membrane protein